MNSRHRAREVALQILYRNDVTIPTAGTPGITPVNAIGTLSPPQLIQELQHHFSHFQVPENLHEFVGEFVSGTLLKMKELDATLEKHASNWKVGRMSYVDRSLLRMATYELMYLPETPPSVVIDEAIELGKQFGTAETSGFVNGILDSIKSSIKNSAQSSGTHNPSGGDSV